MNLHLIKTFECYPLSAARRLFVLEQILARHPSESLGDRCRSIIDIDRTLLREQRERQRQLRHNEWEFLHRRTTLSSLDELNGAAHRRFIALVRFVVKTMSPEDGRRLLAPALRQLERLQQLTHRSLRSDNHDVNSDGKKSTDMTDSDAMRPGL